MAINQLNLASILGNVAAIKGQEIQNRLGEAQILAFNDQQARDRQVNNLMGGFDYAAGMTPENVNRLGQVYGLDRQAGSQVYEFLSSIDEADRLAATERADMFARDFAGIVSAPEEDRERLYGDLLARYGSSSDPDVVSAVEGLPAQYDESALWQGINRARSIEDILKRPERWESLTAKDLAAIGLDLGTAAQRNAATGEIDVLQQPDRTDPRDSFTTLSPEEVVEQGFRAGSVIQRNDTTGALSVVQSPESGPSPTLDQQASNAEILAAREYLDSLGLTREELQRRTRKTGDIGQPNPDLDPFLAKIVETASSPLVGVNDPGYADTYGSIYGGSGIAPGSPDPNDPLGLLVQ